MVREKNYKFLAACSCETVSPVNQTLATRAEDAVIATAIVNEFDYIEWIDCSVAIAELPQGLLARASAAFGRSGASILRAQERHGRKFRRDIRPEPR